jgi:phosphoribosylformylglycinamidine (FGAM) synthase-like amidotransferase family enzyme
VTPSLEPVSADFAVSPSIQVVPSSPTVSEYDEEDETIHFSQISQIDRSFWYLCGTAILLYGGFSYGDTCTT